MSTLDHGDSHLDDHRIVRRIILSMYNSSLTETFREALERVGFDPTHPANKVLFAVVRMRKLLPDSIVNLALNHVNNVLVHRGRILSPEWMFPTTGKFSVTDARGRAVPVIVCDFDFTAEAEEKQSSAKLRGAVPLPDLAEGHVRLFHGTSSRCASSVAAKINANISAVSDFGPAFYTTPNFDHAFDCALIKALLGESHKYQPVVFVWDVPQSSVDELVPMVLTDDAWKDTVQFYRVGAADLTGGKPTSVKHWEASSPALVIGSISSQAAEPSDKTQYAFRSKGAIMLDGVVPTVLHFGVTRGSD